MTDPRWESRPVVVRAPHGSMRSLAMDGATLRHFRLVPGFRPEPHEHGGAHACVVLRGGFEERDGRTSMPCGPGAARVSPADDSHDLRTGDSGLVCLVIEARPAARIPAPRRRAYLHDPALAALAAGLLRTLDEPAACTLELETLALELLAATCRREGPRAPARPPGWLREARARIDETPEEPLAIGTLAAGLGVNRVHLVETFRRHFGLPPGEYQRRRRCLLARRLLLETRQPIVEVALAAGFADQSHLTRTMRRQLGVTPGALRGGAPPPEPGPSTRHPFKPGKPGAA